MAKPKRGHEDKMTRKEAERVAELYDLGEVKSWKYVSGGLINYNFHIKTDKGDFIVRRLGYSLSNPYWKRQKRLEYSLVSYLHKKDFPYMIPDFMKNNRGKYISSIGKDIFEVYPRIPGEKVKKLNDNQLKEVAKASAIFHRSVKGYSRWPKEDDSEWILTYYKKIRKLKPDSKVNRIARENVDFFESILKRIISMDLNDDLVIGHKDMHTNNLLFDGDKLVGILDFENLGTVSRIHDISYILDGMKPEKWDMFIKAYRKYGPLSKVEERKLLSFFLLERCNIFWWATLSMEKTPELKYKFIRHSVNYAKKLLKMAKKEKSWK